jgi:enoyl-CoA hydratase/carnithine racemase
MGADERVAIEISDGIADVAMTRGDKHNALDWAMFTALNDALDQLEGNDEVRAVVLRGEGPSFCSGLDVPSFMGSDVGIEDVVASRDGGAANQAQRVAYGWRELPVPVIAALRGACFGGGLQIALGADIRIAAPDTRMSVMEMKYGLIPDMSLTRTLPRLVRDDVARELTYTARIVESGEALELGLVTRISERAVEDARELAETIAGQSVDAVRSAKRLWNEAWNAPDEEGLALEEELQRALISKLGAAASAAS